FFQAEDGIRDFHVTGVQTCALPILPLLWAILALMRGAGDNWWLYAWLVWVGFNMLVLYAYPTIIAPLFNRFEPLPDGGVRERVRSEERRGGEGGRSGCGRVAYGKQE